MGWEEQGRQYHGRFGSGTSGAAAAPGAPQSADDHAATVVFGAAALMPLGLAREFQTFVSRGSGESTLQAMDAWAAAAALPGDQFRKLVAGPDMSPAATASLQAMAQEIATSGDMDAASRHLAAAVMDGGRADAIYRFAGAQYRAAFAEANGLLPDGPAKAEAPSEAVPDNPVVLAAAGDLKCEGFSGGCQNGGSFGTTAAYTVLGRNVCRSCAVKMIGAGDEPGGTQNQFTTR